MVKLNADDQKNLLDFLRRLPILANEQGRVAVFISSGLDELRPHVDLSGPATIAVPLLVNFLCSYGQLDEEQTALGRLLMAIEETVGAEQRVFLNDIITKYKLMPPIAKPPFNTGPDKGITPFTKPHFSQTRVLLPGIVEQQNKKPSDEQSYETDYTKLREHLETGAWRKADLATIQIILEVEKQTKTKSSKHKKTETIDFKTFEKKFPCFVLVKIDQLWRSASHSRFGLTVQREILYNFATVQNILDKRNFSQNFHEFGEHVGWRINDNWLSYDDLIFNLEAKEGHLPSWRFPAFENTVHMASSWETNVRLLLSCLEHCL